MPHPQPPSRGNETPSRRALLGPAAGPLLAGVALPYLASADDMTRGGAPLPAYVFALGAATLWWSARRSVPRALLAAKAGALVLVLLVASAGWVSGLDDGVLPLVPLLAGAAAGCVAGGALARACTSRRGLAVWSAAAAAAAFLLARPPGTGPSTDEAFLATGTALLIATVAAALALLAAPRHPASPASTPGPAPDSATSLDPASDSAAGSAPSGEPDEPVGGPPERPRAGERAAFGLVVFAAFALGLGPGGTYSADPVLAPALLCGLGVAAILVGIAPGRRGAVYAAAAAPAVVALGWGGAESAMRVADGVSSVLIGVVAVLVGTIAAARLPERPRTLAIIGSALVALGAVWWVWQPAWAGPEAYLGGAGLGGGLLLGALLRLRRPLAVGVLAIAVCAAPVGAVAAATLGGGPTPPGAQTLSGAQGGLGETHARIGPQPSSPGPDTGSGAGADGGGADGGGADGGGARGDGAGTAAPRLGEELPYGGDVPRGRSSYAPVEPCRHQEEQDGELVCVAPVPDQNLTVVLHAKEPLAAEGPARPTGLLVILAILAGGAALALARRPRLGGTGTSTRDRDQ